MRRIKDFLSSVRLALALLIAILICCVVGVTIFRGERAWDLIFNTLWFNGLLALLVLNVAFCFFGRIWGRKLTIISFGMILFHLSFVAILCGIVYNSLFYFNGTIRLTEGETLPNGDLESYDHAAYGRFFPLSRLKGETSLIKLRIGYMVDGINKKVAYEISVGEGHAKKQDIIYPTRHTEYRGFRYFPDKEGYSVLTILYDKREQEIFGAHLPLQSLKQSGDKYLYTVGTKDGPGRLAFPPEPARSLFDIQVTYLPDPLKERAGEAVFLVWPLEGSGGEKEQIPGEGKAPIGDKIKTGDHFLSVTEVRYWTAMHVRYDPGQPIVLASLWVGLSGMIITFAGRLIKERRSSIGM